MPVTVFYPDNIVTILLFRSGLAVPVVLQVAFLLCEKGVFIKDNRNLKTFLYEDKVEKCPMHRRTPYGRSTCVVDSQRHET